MSRAKRFAHALASGYLMMGANVFYTLMSVPLALHYLGKKEFGLWALATTIGSYLTVVDFGLGASLARILVDHKDHPHDGKYGGMIKTGLLVGLAQGMIILFGGGGLAHFAGAWLGVEIRLQTQFKWLITGLCAVLALGSVFRTFSHILSAHQRSDISNYSQTILFFLSLGVMWLGFATGCGVYSILLAQAFTVIITIFTNMAACLRLGLLPSRNFWGQPSWREFKHVFAFGNDIFLYTLGAQLINFSQNILLTRLIGLDAVAIWSICTRVFILLQMAIYRIFDYSSAAFAEMMVRGERAKLASRFRQVTVVSASLSVAAASIFAVCNSAFVNIWTNGRLETPFLTEADVKVPTALAHRLIAHEDSTALSIWEQFSVETRDRLIRSLAKTEIDNALPALLTTNLNLLIDQGAQATSTSDIRWSNRHRLEDALAPNIADSRKTRWLTINDLLLALWLLITVSLHAHTGLAGQTKSFGFMRYIFLLEGLVFVGVTIVIMPWLGITGMLAISVCCSLGFSFTYGLNRTRKYLGVTFGELALWHRAPLRLALRLFPVAGLLAWLTQSLPTPVRLALNAGVVGSWALLTFLQIGLDPALRQELFNRLPKPLRPWLARLG
jgi:O-antigen/teichoic acid export membrane protein